MKDDYDRSVERVARSEDQRAKLTGFGTTKQGRALARRYCERLADSISADVPLAAPSQSGRLYGASKDDDLALRLSDRRRQRLLCPRLGADRDGEKNFRDIALWIGRNLGQRGETAVEVGGWGVDMLLSLPIFALVDGDVLTFR